MFRHQKRIITSVTYKLGTETLGIGYVNFQKYSLKGGIETQRRTRFLVVRTTFR